jgi:chloramphenicol 3-O phosphotransferase
MGLPFLFEGLIMTPGTVILINGTSSSGKTSIVRALQDLLAAPFLEAGIDKFIWMLPPRYLERPLWDDVLGLADHAGEAGHTLVAGMHQAIEGLSRTGNNVIADHVLVEPGWLGDIAYRLFKLPAYFIGVRCPLEVLENRERQRKNRTLGQARLQYDLVHIPGIYDLEVDTSRFTPEECAAQIKTLIDSGQSPYAFRQIKDRLENST